MDHPAPAASPRRSLRVRLVATAVLAVVTALLLTAPLPGYVVRPGPAFGLADRVEVPGVDPLDGDYLFTTIRLDPATVARALGASLDGEASLVTERSIRGGESEEAFLAHQRALFASTEERAIGLALAAVGSDLDPASVEVADDGVGGPSAGLLIALAVADLAGELDLAGGRLVSGTGAVEADGTVTPVGSVADKVAAAEAAGAEVFVVPEAQEAEARATGTAMSVIGIDTFADALSALSRG